VHALVVTVSIDGNRMEEAARELQTRVVPLVKQTPGLVHAYWLAPQDGKGFSLILYENEQSATQAAEMARNSPTPEFVKFDSIEVREVVAQA
jgi:hypothetical protein